MKKNVKEFIFIITDMIIIFLLASFIFNWKVGLILVALVHFMGMSILLINFLKNSYAVTIKLNSSDTKMKLTGVKRFLLLLFFSFIWEYVIFANVQDE